MRLIDVSCFTTRELEFQINRTTGIVKTVTCLR